MELKYLLNGEIKSASSSNEDLEIVELISGNQHKVEVKALKGIVLLSAKDSFEHPLHKDNQYFLNGYQSWTETVITNLDFKEKNIKSLPKFFFKKFPVQMYGDSELYPYSRKTLHAWDIFYIEGKDELFIMNNNYKNAYLIIEIMKKGNLINLYSDIENASIKEGESFVVFDYEMFSSKEEGMRYFETKYPRKGIEKLFGYSSWYNYYQNITEEIILRDLEGLDQRFNLFQIDDGYETFVGDWFDVNKEKFPNGLEPVCKKIHEKGYKAGLWLAPFVAEEKSLLFQQHPELFRKDKNGNPIKVGVNWSGQYLLDIENEEAVKHIVSSLKHYADMGFDLFKLDFLYAINCADYEGKTRSQMSEYAYQILVDALKGKDILGCGGTLTNCIDRFSYLRIGMDMEPKFKPSFLMSMLHREVPNTKATIQNTITRSFMNDRWFGNDPDVFLLRDYNMKLSFEQKRALATINALFGTVFLNSDDMATYTEETRKVLDHSLDIFKNAKDATYELVDKHFHITYMLGDTHHEFDYDINKGVMYNER